MAQRTLPGIGLTGYWVLGYDGWKDENDVNLRLLSALVQGSVISRDTTLPSGTQGDIYIAKSDHSTNPLEVAIYDDGAWVYIAPDEGWIFFVQDEGFHVFWDGDSWEQVGSGAPVDPGNYPINAQTGTTYTFVSADKGHLCTFDNGSSITATIDTEANQPFAAGDWIRAAQIGNGALSLAAAVGVTIVSFDDAVDFAGKGALALLEYLGSDVWLVDGNLVA